MTRILIAAGGTAGHVVPALAVAGALRAEGAEVAWAGGDRAEARLVPEAGYPLHALKVEGLSRTNPLKALRAALRAVGAFATAWRLVRDLRPDAVLGGGGYVAGPVGLAALLRHVPVVLTEADSHLGLTNRVLAPFARRVCLAFPLAGREGGRYLVTGRPVPAPVTDVGAARARFHIDPDERCVLVFGGSLGARSINLAAIRAWGDEDPGFRVLHACGTRDFDALVDELGDTDAKPWYDLRPYIDGFADAIAACDLCVARAGGSVFEVAAHGRPAILVPYPHAAADHQTGNARWMVDAGAAEVVADDALTPDRLRADVARLLSDPVLLGTMALASAALARPDAAEVIAEEVLRAAGEKAHLDGAHP